MERCEYRMSDAGVCTFSSINMSSDGKVALPITWVSDGHLDQFVQHVGNDLCRMRACLVRDRIAYKNLTATERSCSSDFRIVVIDVRQRTSAHKFI